MAERRVTKKVDTTPSGELKALLLRKRKQKKAAFEQIELNVINSIKSALENGNLFIVYNDEIETTAKIIERVAQEHGINSSRHDLKNGRLSVIVSFYE